VAADAVDAGGARVGGGGARALLRELDEAVVLP